MKDFLYEFLLKIIQDSRFFCYICFNFLKNHHKNLWPKYSPQFISLTNILMPFNVHHTVKSIIRVITLFSFTLSSLQSSKYLLFYFILCKIENLIEYANFHPFMYISCVDVCVWVCINLWILKFLLINAWKVSKNWCWWFSNFACWGHWNLIIIMAMQIC